MFQRINKKNINWKSTKFKKFPRTNQLVDSVEFDGHQIFLRKRSRKPRLQSWEYVRIATFEMKLEDNINLKHHSNTQP